MEGSAKTKIIVVCGPTASGKTALALALAHRFAGEMVGADSMQVYKGLVVGTAALQEKEAQGIPQHLVGFLPPDEPFSVAEYQKLADETIKGISARGHLPVVCGGTGLYIESLVKGTAFTPGGASAQLREQLQKDWDEGGEAAVMRRLEKIDPEAASLLHPNDKTRIIRALEQALLTGNTKKQRDALSKAGKQPFQALCIGLNFEDRAVLYRRINQRVDSMMQDSLLEEARMVYDHRDSYKTAVQAIGYKEFFPFFEGEVPLEACVDKLKQATRNYAKRQLTWFRRMEGIHWLSPLQAGYVQQAGRLVEAFLQKE